MHPLIGSRAGSGGTEEYVLGTGLSVSEIVAVVAAQGGVDQAAELLRLDPRLVGAAVAFDADPNPTTSAGQAKADSGGSAGILEIVAKVFALFAGIASLIYIAGSIVLSLRLAFEHLPYEAVVAQLPREFVISTGVAHVLLPALLVGCAYALYRLLRQKRPGAPRLHRWREGGGNEDDEAPATSELPSHLRWRIAVRYALTAAALLIPGAAVLVIRTLVDGGRDPEFEWLLAAYVVMLIFAIAFHEGRAILADEYKESWNGLRAAAIMSGLYAAVAVPAMMAMGAALPLNEAKVCTTTDFEERGVLVGQSGDRVYLGEETESDRRLSVIPLSQVEELFIGKDAKSAGCDFADARWALVANQQANQVAEAAGDLPKQISAVRGATHPELPAKAGEAAVTGEKAGNAALATFDAAFEFGAPALGEPAQLVGFEIRDLVERLGAMIDEYESVPAGHRPELRAAILRQLGEVLEAVQRGAAEASAAADAVQADAERQQPTS